MLLMILMLGSLPLIEFSSIMKYTICPLMTGPVILIGTTPLCHGGILSVDLTVPIVVFCSQFHMLVRNLPSLCILTILFLVPSMCKRKLLLIVYARNNLHIWESVTNYKIVGEFEFCYPQV